MKMFKNKSDLSLPPLPKPPTIDQMIDDVKSADIRDPVFLGYYQRFLKNNYFWIQGNIASILEKEFYKLAREGSCKRMFEERTKLDIKFETVKEFIGVSDSLNILVKETEEKLSRLQSNREELDEMRENIKEQAVKALN